MKELILLPMGIIANLLMVKLNLTRLGNKGETPVVTQDPPTDPPPVTDPPEDPPQPSAFESLKTTKGMKNDDEFAKSYTEAEVELGRRQTKLDTVKTQLETQGFTLDDSGNVVQIGNMPPIHQQNQQNQQPQYDPYAWPTPGQNQGQGQDPIYDPYTGLQITNPLDLQLAQLPVGQRTAVVVDAMLTQRDKQNHSSSLAENKVLSEPGAKGFEADVRKVMMNLPLNQRSDEKQWQDALLKVKGMRYDAAMKSAGKEGVDAFINKENAQGMPSSGGGKGGIKLSVDEESTFKWYQDNRPGMFKDKAHFRKASTANYKG